MSKSEIKVCEKLLPCPYCGGNAYIHKDDPGVYSIHCKSKSCSACIGFTNKEETIKQWNTRNGTTHEPAKVLNEWAKFPSPGTDNAFPSCATSVSRYFLDRLNSGEYDELLERLAVKLGKYREEGN